MNAGRRFSNRQRRRRIARIALRIALTVWIRGVFDNISEYKNNNNLNKLKMLKLKFNKNFKTIQLITNKNINIKIFKSYILIQSKDLEKITKILDSQFLKYKVF